MAFDSRSPSQIETWEGCQRKYGWSYVVGIRSPPTESQLLGTEVDDGCLQPYFRDGKPLPDTKAGRIAASALPWLPDPETAKAAGCTQQFRIKLPGAKGAPWYYNGYEDFDVPVGGLLPNWSPALAYAEEFPAVVDFKTCKNFNYAHDAVSLKENAQAVIYGLNTMYRLKVGAVRLRWIYMPTTTDKPKARAVDAVLTAKEAIPVFLAIEATAAEIHEYLSKAPPRKYGEVGGPEHEAYVLATKPNPDHCDKYGGCPYKSRCNLSPSELSDPWATDEDNKEEFHVSISDIKARVAARKAAAATGGSTTTPEVTVTPPTTESLKKAKGINPPEKGVEVPPVAETATTAEVAPTKRTRRTKAEMAAARAAEVADAADQAIDSAIEKLEKAAETAKGLDADDTGTTFSVTWAEETFQPEPFYAFRVGPFHANGTVQPGETLVQAMNRVNAGLEAFAEAARVAKASAFVKQANALKKQVA